MRWWYWSWSTWTMSKEMATVEVYSGLSTDRPFDEVHRFGGLGDGQWRTVRAPAPADMIYLHLPSRTVRFRLASPGGALRIRSARLVAPLPDEQARYEAACREWVARAQKRARNRPHLLGAGPGSGAARKMDRPPLGAVRPELHGSGPADQRPACGRGRDCTFRPHVPERVSSRFSSGSTPTARTSRA